jgi:FKBP-type peptidyl-prolyl cis-trans isomerase
MRRFLSFLVALAACADAPAPPVPPASSASPGSSAPDLSAVTYAPALGVEPATMSRTPRGVLYRDLVPGTGEPVGAGKLVAIHYAGSLPDGTPFDANGPSDPPYEFRLGAGDVVPGFDEAVTGMKVGGKRQVVIPPALGYGAQANGPIPANSVLVFTIDLVSAR